MNLFGSRPSFYFIVLVFSLVAISTIRFRCLDVPLERDEGEYAYAGQLLLDGVAPFSQAFNMKMPGIYVAYAAILGCFGQTPRGVHMGLLIINILSAFLLYGLTARLFDKRVACFAGVAFAVSSLSSSVLGLSANAEQFVVLFALAGLLLLAFGLSSVSAWTLFVSGFMLGACFLMKQHGVAFVLCALILVSLAAFKKLNTPRQLPLKTFMLFYAGIAFPVAIVFVWLWHAGVFSQFWFWTFSYAREYVAQVGFMQGLRLFSRAFSAIVSASPALWILALAGWFCLLFDKSSNPSRFFTVLFTVASFASICPGFYFREHYFILLLPAVSLVSALAVNALLAVVEKRNPASRGGRVVFVVLIAGVIALTGWKERRIFFQLSPRQISRFIYGVNPFPESCVIADSLRVWTRPDETIAVVGSEPQICFYAHRRSATSFIYTYALMENHPFALRMQETMIREIESNKPSYLVFVNVPQSWLIRPSSRLDIFTWFDRYQREVYELTGIADIVSFDKTIYRWGIDVKNYGPQSKCWLAIFKRKALSKGRG